MPSYERMLELEEEYLADDLSWSREAAECWTEEAAIAFFASGGLERPGEQRPTGAGAAEPTPAEPVANAPDDSGPSYLAPVCYEVVHSYVHIRAAPSVSSASRGMKKRGESVLADLRQGAWIRLVDNAGFMLLDGQEVKLGELMKLGETVAPPEARWQVTRPGGCATYAQPGADERTGWLAEAATADVAGESGGWVRVRQPTDGADVWVELDAFLAG